MRKEDGIGWMRGCGEAYHACVDEAVVEFWVARKQLLTQKGCIGDILKQCNENGVIGQLWELDLPNLGRQPAILGGGLGVVETRRGDRTLGRHCLLKSVSIMSENALMMGRHTEVMDAEV